MVDLDQKKKNRERREFSQVYNFTLEDSFSHLLFYTCRSDCLVHTS